MATTIQENPAAVEGLNIENTLVTNLKAQAECKAQLSKLQEEMAGQLEAITK